MADTIFSKQLLSLRKQKGVTQEQLANVLGVSAQAISKWENGSYPEGDLLPRIADYFEVSIDYLYGKDNGKVSLNQQVVNEFKQYKFNVCETDTNKSQYYDKMLDLLWATHIGAWSGSSTYYDRPAPNVSTGRTCSFISSDSGFSFMRMNDDLQYHFVLKEPEKGFAAFYKQTPELAETFAFFGDADNLKIIYFLLTMREVECIEPAVIAKRTGVSEEKAAKAFLFLTNIGNSSGNRMTYEVSILDDKKGSKKAYACNNSLKSSLLMLLAAMDAFINPPHNFQLQINCRNNPWLQPDRS